MLNKLPNPVFVPAIPYIPYRPYSKTCPPVPPVAPPNQPITKTVCGTYSIDISLAQTQGEGYGTSGVQRIQTTSYDVPGIAIPSVSVLLDTSGFVGHVGSGSYCTTVTSYG